MNGWIKKFVDGNPEVGSDQAVKNRLASWSHGRLDGMVAALISNNKQLVVLEGPGEYWQSDDWEATLSSDWEPRLVKRRLQRKIEPTDSFAFVEKDAKNHIFRCRVLPTGQKPAAKFTYIMPLGKEQVGQWLTLELDEATSAVSMKVQKERI